MTRPNFKAVSFQISAALSASSRRESSLSTILYHRFFFDGDSRDKARDRLKRQLEWMRSEYTPLSLFDVTSACAQGALCTLPKYPLLVTADDAKTDLLAVHDIFFFFDVPLAIFVCAGWTSQAEPAERRNLPARIVAAIEWYRGPDFVIRVGDERLYLHVGTDRRAATIDQFIHRLDDYAPHLSDIVAQFDDKDLAAKERERACTWRELSDLGREGAQFGAHSVSHVPLASASRRRMVFEIHESKRLTDEALGATSAFAYPYGEKGTFNTDTTEELKKAGMACAFSTHPAYTDEKTDPFQLPRFALPDRDMSLGEFRARVRGGGILLSKAKRIVAG